MRPLNTDEYILRFTPHKDDSPYSLRNRSIVERLIAEGEDDARAEGLSLNGV